MRFADIDAVTVDGYGTLLTLINPIGPLGQALSERGVERTPAEISGAFATEVAYYRPRAHVARDIDRLDELQRDCTEVFLQELEALLDPRLFAPAFMDALRFEPVPGAVETLELLRERGLMLAVVANWDCGLPSHLSDLGLESLFSVVVTSAEAGVPKPDPAPFLLALERLGVEADRALHVGDEPADEAGSRAAGMIFAPAPLARAFEGWG
jgi:HAD superfamily hydrolase (TIGR01509 family)